MTEPGIFLGLATNFLRSLPQAKKRLGTIEWHAPPDDLTIHDSWSQGKPGLGKTRSISITCEFEGAKPSLV